MRIERKETIKVPSFMFFFKRGIEGVGGFTVGKLAAVRVFRPKGREHDMGVIEIDSRVNGPNGWENVRVALSDLYLAKQLSEYTKGTPSNPSIIGKYIVIVVEGVTGDKGWHSHAIFVGASLEAVIAEANESVDLRDVHGQDFVLDNQTWFDGIEVPFAEWRAKNPDPDNFSF